MTTASNKDVYVVMDTLQAVSVTAGGAVIADIIPTGISE